MTFTSDPSQTFTTIINEERYDFKVVYNANYDYWVISISLDSVELVNGIKMVTQTQLTSQHPQVPFNLYSSGDEDANGENIEEFVLEVSLKNG